jgi:hypothetical protein
MGRLIEVQDPNATNSPILAQVGDMLQFYASGGRVLAGQAVAEWVGAYLTATLGTNGDVVAAAGPPNSVFVRIIGLGSATVELMTGDPWHRPSAIQVQIDAK